MQKCKVCLSDTFQFSHENLNMQVPMLYPLNGNLDLYCCMTCGFVANLTSNTDNDYVNYYSLLNKHSSRASKDLVDEDRGYFDSLIKHIVSTTGIRLEDSSILDYGAGANIFGELCLTYGAQQIVNYDVGMESLGDQKFDLVVSTHCFEHLIDPLGEIRKLSQFVSDGGILAIATPDISGYPKCYYGPYNQFDLEHINHFSPSSMTRLFTEAGLHVVAVRQGERRVAKSLAYSDLLVIARNIQDPDNKVLEIEKFNPDDFLNTFLSYQEIEFDKVKEDISDWLLKVKQVPKAITVFYGLSSYAFRVIAFLRRANLLDKIDYFADSDVRLSSMYMIPGKKILSRTEFDQLIRSDSQTISRSQVFIAIASVNSSRIVEMFESEPNLEHCVVKVIGPSTQNR